VLGGAGDGVLRGVVDESCSSALEEGGGREGVSRRDELESWSMDVSKEGGTAESRREGSGREGLG